MLIVVGLSALYGRRAVEVETGLNLAGGWYKESIPTIES